MSKNKKAQGLSLNAIVIAVLALGVLVVLLLIFSGNIGGISKNLGSCLTKGGECAKSGQCPPTRPIPLFVTGDCEQANPKNLCCIKDSSSEDSPSSTASPSIPSQSPTLKKPDD